MSYAIKCPHCEDGQVEVAKKLWFIQGWLIFTRYGTQTHVGCRPCVSRKVQQTTIRNLLFGWWCFPWGVATPVVVIQNLIAALTTSERTTDEYLRACGIDPAAARVDVGGFAREQGYAPTGVQAER